MPDVSVSGVPVDGILYFHQPGCTHCRTMEAQLSWITQYTPVVVVSCDAIQPQNVQVVTNFSIASTPTCIVLRGGQPVGQYAGVISAADLLKPLGIAVPRGPQQQQPGSY